MSIFTQQNSHQMSDSLFELTEVELEHVIGGKKNKKKVEIEVNNQGGGNGGGGNAWEDRYFANRSSGQNIKDSAVHATI